MDTKVEALVVSLIRDKVFGNVEFVSLKKDLASEKGAQFGSTIDFAELTVQSDTGETLVPLVIKTQMENLIARVSRDGATMHLNEVSMYDKVLPFLKAEKVKLFPKMYYGLGAGGDNTDNDILLLENVKSSGFVLSKELLTLDFEHIALTMKRLGEFHALSHIAKGENKIKFLEFTSLAKPLVPPKENVFQFQESLYVSIERGAKPLLDKNIEVEILNKFLKTVRSSCETLKYLCIPPEEYAVLCHGDFCKNNIFYKYSGNVPIDCIFFDLQMPKYSSPAIDISFFLYMHTTANSRKDYWDEFLKIYWESLRSSVAVDTDIPSFEKFLNDFKCRAIYGYIHCSFFIPIMLNDNPLPYDVFVNLSTEEKCKVFQTIGGEVAQQKITDIVSHLLEKRYIHRFLEFCENNNYSEVS